MTLDELRDLAERLPAGAALTLPREVLLELCDGADVCTVADLTVGQLDWRIPAAAVTAYLDRQRGARRPGGASLADYRDVLNRGRTG